MLTRAVVLEHLQQLPDRFSIDELMERLLFIYKLEQALEQSKSGQVTPHDKVKEKYQRWIG